MMTQARRRTGLLSETSARQTKISGPAAQKGGGARISIRTKRTRQAAPRKPVD
jgi:hypothetical protein